MVSSYGRRHPDHGGALGGRRRHASREATLACALLLVSLLAVPWLAAVPGARAAEPAEWQRYLVLLKGQADLASTLGAADLGARRRAIYEIKRDFAETSQAGVRRWLEDARAQGRVGSIVSYWISNALAFTGEPGVAETIAQRPEVDQVQMDAVVFLDNPEPAAPRLPVGGVEWNVAKIRAPEVWASGLKGSRVVVGTIDSGAELVHPAFGGRYRGSASDAPPSWFDATDPPSANPVDEHGHGTHVLGSILGGVDPQGIGIGVAPEARWVAARAFDRNGRALLSQVLLAMQWMQAPFRPGGLPDPEHPPDVVNGSWHVEGCQAWFRAPLLSWLHAGIFPVFSVGNKGNPLVPGSDTVGSPSDAPEAVGAGATDSSDALAPFSRVGRIPSCNPDAGPDRTKPDVVAPGVDVRSSFLGGTYAILSGTSMAAPHVAGTIALMVDALRQAAPNWQMTLEESNRLRTALRATAVELGPAGCDAFYGCGRVNAKGAVQRVANGGTLAGAVVDSSTSKGIEGARVTATATGDARDVASALTDAGGNYTIAGLLGPYSVEAKRFGYVAQAKAVGVSPGELERLDFALAPAEMGTIAGKVTLAASGEGVPGAIVRVEETPLSTTTAADGTYTIAGVPQGNYTITASHARCTIPQSRSDQVIAPNATTTINFGLEFRRDASGYFCSATTSAFIPGSTRVDLAGDDRWTTVDLPFAFPFYEGSSATGFTRAFVSTNGFLRFDAGSAEFSNGFVPSSSPPNLAVYPLWDDLIVDAESQVLSTKTPNAFTIEWRNVGFVNAPGDRITFEVTLHRNGDVEFQYGPGAGPAASGISATVGIEGGSGSEGVAYSFNEAAVSSGVGIVFSRGTVGLLAGTVLDSGSAPVADAIVTASGAGAPRSTRTDAAGRYRMWLPPGSYSVEASKFGFQSKSGPAAVSSGATTTLDFTPANGLALVAQTFLLHGKVLEEASGAPLGGVEVEVSTSEISRETVTGPDGDYSFSLPAGTYDVTAAPTGRCQETRRAPTPVTLGSPGDAEQDFGTRVIRDSFGYTCRESTFTDSQWIPGNDELELTGDDASQTVALPFAFPFYGASYRAAHVATNGFVRFDTASAEFQNGPIPFATPPNVALYPFWDDLLFDERSALATRDLSGAAFVIEWRNVAFRMFPDIRVTFEAILHAGGKIEYLYRSGAGALSAGAGATIGIEDRGGTVGFQYSLNEQVLDRGLRLVFEAAAPPSVFILRGRVTDAADPSRPVPGIPVHLDDPDVPRSLTDADGRYAFSVPAGLYQVTASGRCAGSTTAGAAVSSDLEVNLSLPTLGDTSYQCDDWTQISWAPGQLSLSPIALTGDDESFSLPLPFPVRVYGVTSVVAHISTNGSIRFDRAGPEPPGTCRTIPCEDNRRLAVDPFWADLVVDDLAQVLVGMPNSDVILVEWRNVRIKGTSERVTFEAVVHAAHAGHVQFQYLSVPATLPAEIVRVVGVEHPERALQYSFEPKKDLRVRFLSVGP